MKPDDPTPTLTLDIEQPGWPGWYGSILASGRIDRACQPPGAAGEQEEFADAGAH
jgi:hypothetical protein